MNGFASKHWLALSISVAAAGLEVSQGASYWQLLALAAVVLAWGVATTRSAQPAVDEVPVGLDEACASEGIDIAVAEPMEATDIETHEDVPTDEEPIPELPSASDYGAESAIAFSDASSAAVGVLCDVQSSLDRVQSLISDAVATLATSFTGLKVTAREQSALVRGLVETLASQSAEEGEGVSAGTFLQFVSETDQILKEFVALILSVSKESMSSVTRIEEIDEHMAKIDALLVDAAKLAEQSTLLAVNARIQAAHAGDAGKGFGVVADEIHDLARRSHRFNEEIALIVKETKESIDATTEYIGEIASKDMNRTLKAKSRVNEMLSGINETNDQLETSVISVSVLSEKLGVDVADATRSLQFEDIVRQLTQHCETCIGHVTKFLEEMGKEIGGLENDPNAIVNLKAMIDEFANANAPELRSVVSQESVEAGEIELF
ncbi:MAG: hypothetical protein GY725_10800 [bacterium]|nr:hypothetical protein [bacterium]